MTANSVPNLSPSVCRLAPQVAVKVAIERVLAPNGIGLEPMGIIPLGVQGNWNTATVLTIVNASGMRLGFWANVEARVGVPLNSDWYRKYLLKTLSTIECNLGSPPGVCEGPP